MRYCNPVSYTHLEKLVKDSIKKPINDIKQKYRGNKKVAEYLKAVQNYILENIPSFVPNLSLIHI